MDDAIKKLADYIDDNLEKSISVEELAQIWHMHPTHFIRAFKKKTGETPGRFVQIRRMENAKRLIEETELPIREIMCRVGIIDSAQFAKKFKRFYGNTPRNYRKDVKNEKEKWQEERPKVWGKAKTL